jgi:hypothetical protein
MRFPLRFNPFSVKNFTLRGCSLVSKLNKKESFIDQSRNDAMDEKVVLDDASKTLREQYLAVLSEPTPANLVALIERLKIEDR